MNTKEENDFNTLLAQCTSHSILTLEDKNNIIAINTIDKDKKTTFNPRYKALITALKNKKASEQRDALLNQAIVNCFNKGTLHGWETDFAFSSISDFISCDDIIGYLSGDMESMGHYYFSDLMALFITHKKIAGFWSKSFQDIFNNPIYNSEIDPRDEKWVHPIILSWDKFIKPHNTLLVKEFNALFQNPSTKHDERSTLDQLVEELVHFERNIMQLKIDKHCLQNKASLKTNYTGYKVTKERITQVEKLIKAQAEDLESQFITLFGKDMNSAKARRIASAFFAIIGAGLLIAGIGLACTLSPYFAALAVAGGLVIGASAIGLFKQSRYEVMKSSLSRMSSEADRDVSEIKAIK